MSHDQTALVPPFAILRTVEEVRSWRDSLDDPTALGLVPTMGALHEGHLQLVRHSLSTTAHTVVSIFLNPAQFGPTEDLSSYPSTLNSDLALLARLEVVPGAHPIPHAAFDGLSDTPAPPQPVTAPARRVAAVFLPTTSVLFPLGLPPEPQAQRGAFVTVHGLSEQLEGARRPGFFRGVATVVLKFFHIFEPTVAFFGQKDLQQCLVIRLLCADLHLRRPHAVVAVPTVREPSGLALSSRNAYLSPADKADASCLVRFLRHSATRIKAAPLTPTPSELAEAFCPPNPSIELDFVSLNHPVSFEDIPPGTPTPGLPIALSAAILVRCTTGRVVRLTDNILLNHDLNANI